MLAPVRPGSITLRMISFCFAQVLDNGGVEFINEGKGARLRVFAALKHRFMKQVWTAHVSEAPFCPQSSIAHDHGCWQQVKNARARLGRQQNVKECQEVRQPAERQR